MNFKIIYWVSIIFHNIHHNYYKQYWLIDQLFNTECVNNLIILMKLNILICQNVILNVYYNKNIFKYLINLKFQDNTIMKILKIIHYI